jgi:hypothetical protein
VALGRINGCLLRFEVTKIRTIDVLAAVITAGRSLKVERSDVGQSCRLLLCPASSRFRPVGCGLRAQVMWNEVDAFQAALPELAKLERYDWRGWSRCQRAIRQFVVTAPLGPDDEEQAFEQQAERASAI